MHFNAMRAMRIFISKFLKLDPNQKLKILEVGSYAPSYPRVDLVFRRYFRNNPNWEFTGLDLIEGPNVDVVSKFPYAYPFADNTFDVVISGNVLEHVEDTHKFIKEIARIAKDWVCIIVPAERPEHKGKNNEGLDCWRVLPDGMRFLLEDIANLNIISCDFSGKGNNKEDTMGIARKKIQ